MAVKHGFSETQEARFPRQDLGAETTGATTSEIGPLDAIRIAPQVTRAFEAGPDGLELLVFGPHHDRDGETMTVRDFWGD